MEEKNLSNHENKLEKKKEKNKISLNDIRWSMKF